MAELVSNTYSLALFDVGVEENRLDDLYDEIIFLRRTFKEYPEFYELIRTPKVSNPDKKKIVDNVFGEKLSKEIVNFLKIIIDKRRTSFILEITEDFEKKYYDYKGIVKAKAFTSMPLDEAQIKKLEQKLSLKTNKTVQIENCIDKTLIGGVMIKFNDVVIDGTIKGKLESLEKNLNEIIV